MLDPLRSWVNNLDPARPNYDHLRTRALWAFQAHGVVEEDLLLDLLGADNPDARAAATRVVRYTHDRLDADPLALLRKRVRDEAPRVRLQAVIALSHLGRPEAMAAALHALDRPTDRFIDEALANAREALAPHWQRAIRQGGLGLGNDPARVQFLLNGDAPDPVTSRLQQRLTAAKAAAGVKPDDPADLPDVKGASGKQGDLPSGKEIYATRCIDCHRADGQGVDGTFPPLADSELLLDPDARTPIRIVLHGLAGPVKVRGEKYTGYMPPFGFLSDAKLAAVLTYVRSAWGNDASPVSPEAVKAVREEVGRRARPWTAKELTNGK